MQDIDFMLIEVIETIATLRRRLGTVLAVHFGLTIAALMLSVFAFIHSLQR